MTPWMFRKHQVNEVNASPRIIGGMLALAIFFAVSSASGADYTVKIGIAGGYGYDRLTWNIADSDGFPNILSELTFEEIESVVGKLDFQVTGTTWSVEGEVTYGQIANGMFRDDDFALDNRQGLFSRSEGAVDDYDVQGAALMVGYAVIQRKDATLRALFGGRVYRQRLRMTQGTQLVPATGPFSGLNSTYTATWYGPAFGLGLDAGVGETNFRVHVDGTIMRAMYRGSANWNLRTDLQQDPSFTHEASGWGLTTLLKLSYPIGPAELYMGGRFLYFTATDGEDRVFFSNGTVSTTRLNEIESQSLLGFFGVALNW